MKSIGPHLAAVVLMALCVALVAGWIGIGSGLIDVDRLMGAPARVEQFRIIQDEETPLITSGHGYYVRKKERGK
jgi:hypothetical protein